MYVNAQYTKLIWLSYKVKQNIICILQKLENVQWVRPLTMNLELSLVIHVHINFE